MRRPLYRWIVAAMTAVTGFAGVPLANADSGRPPLPAADPFYDQPASLSGARMGQVVDSRPVEVHGVPTSTKFTSWQVKYVSRDTKGKPWTTMAIVMKPVEQTGPPKLVSYQPWVDALDSRCDMSYQLRTDAAYQASTMGIGEVRNAGPLLDRGWTVVVSDYLGPENQFAAGYVEGRGTLDGIRAALNFAPAGLASDTPVALIGYSGGARATEFAAELAEAYAPELNIVGSAAGGLPTDMALTAATINGGPFVGIDFSSAFGLARAYPELNLPAYIEPGLEQAISGMCQAEILSTYAFQYVQNHTVGGVWPLGDPAVAQTLDGLKAGNYGTPRRPLYLWMASDDQIAVTPATDALVDKYCAEGLNVTYVKYPGTEHLTGEAAGFSDGIDWIAARLDGTPATPNCAHT